MDEISQVALFVRVVEEGSFSAAARAMGVTPSAVSRQISQLERDLGNRLFRRTTRAQSLTEAGEIYFQFARRIDEDFRAARLAVAQLSDKPSGTLHVTAEADFAVAFIEPVMRDFLDRYPDIRVRLQMSAGLRDLVHEGIDLAIRVGHLEESNLVARKLATSRSMICASPGYLARRGKPQHPRDLATHDCLSFRTGPGKVSWTFDTGDERIDVPITGPLNVNGLVFLRNAALRGLGIVMIPTWIMREQLEQQTLVPVLDGFEVSPASTPIYAVFAHQRQLAPKVRAFVDFLAERMRAIPA